MCCRLLIINPGSTSTKVAIYDGVSEIFKTTIEHSTEEIIKYKNVLEQFKLRKDSIIKILGDISFDMSTLKAVVGRGGLLKPIESGTYKVNEKLLNDLTLGNYGIHASNLGAIIANEISKSYGIPAYIVDPVVVDELYEEARISGFYNIERKSKFHALNQKAVARRFSNDIGKEYGTINLIVAHLGGGVSVGAHRYGKVVDVNNALDGDGPFSPERSGGVPSGDLIKLCFSGRYTEKDIYELVVGKGGFVGYLGTNDTKEVKKLVEAGDENAIKIYRAFIYQVAKAIGEMSTVLNGDIDGIIFTGGIAYWTELINDLKKKIDWIAPVAVYPGEDEMLALAQGAIRVINGEEEAREYR